MSHLMAIDEGVVTSTPDRVGKQYYGPLAGYATRPAAQCHFQRTTVSDDGLSVSIAEELH